MASKSSATATASTSRKVGSFEVEHELGRGGMGVIYLGWQPALERRVVLKALRRGVVDDPKLEERFRREAQAAASVQHQNVVAVYDYFEWRGEPYIAQEYVDGVDLSTVPQSAGRLPPRVAALIALELVRGLEEIHVYGIVHRDLKPSNILLGKRGQAKIADFGIALDGTGPALTKTGLALGTPQYMSPEQLLGERVDGRTDLFALGALLYEMLVARAPFALYVSEAFLQRRYNVVRFGPAKFDEPQFWLLPSNTVVRFGVAQPDGPLLG